MRRRRKVPKRRSPVAKDLGSAKYRQRIVAPKQIKPPGYGDVFEGNV